jgi:heme/copper-type cytochrome/quinol oxidase subunit 2
MNNLNQSNEPPVPPPGFHNTPPPPSSNPSYNDPQLQKSAGPSSNAIISLVFGILSYFICGLVGGIVAWIVGAVELGKIKRGESNIESKGMATAGMWLGIANVILSVLAILTVLVIIFVILFSHPGNYNWKDV